MESLVVCDTVTGARLLDVKPKAGSAGRVLNTSKSGEVSFEHTERPAGFSLSQWRDLWRDLTVPWARTLVFCWNDKPVYAGVITARAYADETGILTVKHTDIRDLALGSRYPFGVDSYWADDDETIPGKLTITGKSLVSAVGIVTQAALTGPPGGAPYGLPIVLPSLVQSGSFSTVIENFNFRRADDVVAEIQSMEGGPDVDFAPRWSSSGALEWVERVGALTGPMVELWRNASKSAVQSYSTDEDALEQVTGVFGIGEGSGDDLIVGGTPGADVADIPARDTTIRAKNVKDKSTAASIARENLRVNEWPSQKTPISVDRSMVDPASLVLGAPVRVHVRSHPWEPDGYTDFRLLGHSMSVGSSTIELTVRKVPA